VSNAGCLELAIMPLFIAERNSHKLLATALLCRFDQRTLPSLRNRFVPVVSK
jgi:hypothetical protein